MSRKLPRSLAQAKPKPTNTLQKSVRKSLIKALVGFVMAIFIIFTISGFLLSMIPR